MTDYKLTRILKTFSDKEFKEFEKMVLSPFFSPGRDVFPLYNYMKKLHPAYDSPSAEKKLRYENIYLSLYRGKKYEGKKSNDIIKKLFSDMTKLAGEFLFQKKMTGEFLNQKLSLTALAFLDRNLGDYALEQADKSDAIHYRNGIDAEFFKGIITNKETRAGYYLAMDRQQDVAGIIFEAADAALIQFLASGALSLNNMIANKAAYNKDYENVRAFKFFNSLDIDKTIQIFKDISGEFTGSALMYLYLLQLDMKDKDSYYKFKELYYLNFDKLSFNDKSILNHILGTAAVLLKSENYYEFTKETFEIVKFEVEKGIFKQSFAEYTSAIRFRGIFASAMAAEEYQWAENFLKENIHLVNPEYREPMQEICEASLLILSNKFDKALEKMKKIKSDFFTFNFDIRVQTLICYYELGHYENAFSLVDSSKHFLSENKNVSEYLRASSGNFIELYNKILQMKTSGKENEMGYLKKTALSKLPYHFSTWIMKKLEK